MIHKTKGIVLRIVKYGETSVITTMYTELFGVQSYIVKGVRQSGKRSQGKAVYFQPAAMLDMIVYHNELKNLQFVKEFEWAYLYKKIFFDVVKNAVATYISELLLHTLKQPESNTELFNFIEDSLKQLDDGNATLTANLPLYFTLHLSAALGFKPDGEYTKQTPVIDLQEGSFINDIPMHSFYLTGELAEITSVINNISVNDLQNLQLNRNTRKELLAAYQQFIALHIENFTEIRSLKVLQEVLS